MRPGERRAAGHFHLVAVGTGLEIELRIEVELEAELALAGWAFVRARPAALALVGNTYLLIKAQNAQRGKFALDFRHGRTSGFFPSLDTFDAVSLAARYQ